MIVRIEVPAGHKFCKCCGGVFPKDTGFYQQKKLSKATGEVTMYPRVRCKSCHDRENAARPRTRKPVVDRKPKPVTERYLPPRPPVELPIDAAFMGWRAVEVVAFQGARL